MAARTRSTSPRSCARGSGRSEARTPADGRWLWPAVAAGAVAGGFAGLALPYAFHIVSSAVLAAAMAGIAAEDVSRLRVPNALVLFAAIAGLATVAAEAHAAHAETFRALAFAALDAVLCGGALLLLREAFYRLRRVDGLGMGDVKLGAAAGIWLGWQLFAVAVTMAAVGALLFVAIYTVLARPWPTGKRIPFALFLSPAIWIAWWGARFLGAF